MAQRTDEQKQAIAAMRDDLKKVVPDWDVGKLSTVETTAFRSLRDETSSTRKHDTANALSIQAKSVIDYLDEVGMYTLRGVLDEEEGRGRLNLITYVLAEYQFDYEMKFDEPE